MSFLKPLNTIYVAVYTLIDRWRARYRRHRSLEHLETLDDYLLDDIGLKREEESIVPISQVRQRELASLEQQRFRQQNRLQCVMKDQASRLRSLRRLRRRQE